MGQGEMGMSFNQGGTRGGVQQAGLARYRVPVASVLTTLFVAIKAVGHDYWAVGFGLAVLGVILLTPEPDRAREPWRDHALRVVSACFVVVTLASIWTTLAGAAR